MAQGNGRSVSEIDADLRRVEEERRVILAGPVSEGIALETISAGLTGRQRPLKSFSDRDALADLNQREEALRRERASAQSIESNAVISESDLYEPEVLPAKEEAESPKFESEAVRAPSRSSRPEAPPPPPLGPRSGDGFPEPHPILEVEGRYARLEDIVNLKLAGGAPAFSDAVLNALIAACRLPLRTINQARTVIGPVSFLRAALGHTVRSLDTGNASRAIEAIVLRVFDLTIDRYALAERLLPQTMSPPPDQVLADPALTQVLAAASRIAGRLTPGQVRIDMRHMLLALLATVPGQRVFYETGAVRRDPKGFFDGLFNTVAGHIVEQNQKYKLPYPDDERALKEIITDLKYLPEAADRRSETHYLGDVPLRDLKEDDLGVADEARALAEVVCLRKPGPPLAIGLFGDWGSGKSTFMNMLEKGIDELTEAARRAKKEGTGAGVMIAKAVHIKFNAWHYNDANLWASLTSEFFEQLRAGGADSRPEVEYATLVDAVARKVAAAEREAGNQAASVSVSSKAIDDLKKEIRRLHKERDRAVADAAGVAAAELISRLGDRGAAGPVLDRLGYPLDVPEGKKTDAAAIEKAEKDRQEALQEDIKSAAELTGSAVLPAKMLWRAMRNGDPWTIGLLALLVLGIGVGVAAAMRLEPIAIDWVKYVAMIGGAGGLLLRIGRRVGYVFGAVKTYRAERKDKAVSLESALTEKQDALSAAEEARAAAVAAQKENAAEADRFRARRPDQVLDYFLNVSEDTRSFDKELGTISRVRRAFEQLNAIFVERAKAKALVHDPDASDTDRASAEAQLKELKRVTDDIDRIVLYVDDLDRCSASQVVKVLEAVHLLLAFPLFVVVVGVDARWLQKSVLNVYNKQLRDTESSRTKPSATNASAHRRKGGDPSSVDAADPLLSAMVDQATVQDYLEKIFQIPIHLKTLDTDLDRFKAFLKKIAEPQAEPAPRPQPQPAPGPDKKSTPVKTGAPGVTRIAAVSLSPEDETFEETEARVMLRPEELALITQLAPLLGKSPRVVKRFLNVYRLVRGLNRGEDLIVFLEGSAGTAPAYPAVLFWLAVRLGLSEEMAEHVRTAVLELTAADLAKPLQVLGNALTAGKLDTLPGNVTPSARTAIEAIRRMESEKVRKNYREAIAAIDRVLPDKIGVQSLREWEDQTLRFTLAGPNG